MSQSNPHSKSIDAVVVGAGFAGIYMLQKLRQQGLAAPALAAHPPGLRKQSARQAPALGSHVWHKTPLIAYPLWPQPQRLSLLLPHGVHFQS